MPVLKMKQFVCIHYGDLGPPFPTCTICSERAADKDFQAAMAILQIRFSECVSSMWYYRQVASRLEARVEHIQQEMTKLVEQED